MGSNPLTGQNHVQLECLRCSKPRPEKKGIPGFRARHQKMKAEWSEKWSATKEEWGDEDWGDGWDDEDWGDEDWGGEWEEGW